MRAYIRGIHGLPAELQRKTAKHAGCTSIYEEGVDHDARANWIKSFGVSKDMAEPAWVYRLDVLAFPRSQTGMSPGADLTDTLISLLGKAKEVVEFDSGFTSQNSREFKDRVKWARDRANRKQKVDYEQKRKAGKKGARTTKANSVVRLWKSPVMAADRETARKDWCDPKHRDKPKKRWLLARAALPEQLRGCSYTSLWRIFGGQDGVQKKTKKRRGRPRSPA